jgi:hypothetical protein
VKEPFIDVRAIHSSFVGKAKYGGNKDTIVRMHFDLIALLVQAGKLKRGTGTGGIGKNKMMTEKNIFIRTNASPCD